MAAQSTTHQCAEQQQARGHTHALLARQPRQERSSTNTSSSHEVHSDALLTYSDTLPSTTLRCLAIPLLHLADKAALCTT